MSEQRPTAAEALAIGHTLIAENHWHFYDQCDDDDDQSACGCAVGAIYVAVERQPDGSLPDLALSPDNFRTWLESEYPWMARKPFGHVGALVARLHIGCGFPFWSYASAISALHHMGIPRMTLRVLIEQDDPTRAAQ